jgi:hypothetical protein
MPAPQIVETATVPKPKQGKPTSPSQRFISTQLVQFKDHLYSLSPGKSMLFSYDTTDDEDFSMTGARGATLKDRYRRMFRTGMKEAGIRSADFEVVYQVPMETLPTGEVSVGGFSAWLTMKDGVTPPVKEEPTP